MFDYNNNYNYKAKICCHIGRCGTEGAVEPKSATASKGGGIIGPRSILKLASGRHCIFVIYVYVYLHQEEDRLIDFFL